MAFHLRKWYLDVVTEDGRAFVGYWACLRWGVIRLHYHGHLVIQERHSVRASNHFKKVAEPVLEGEQLAWQFPGTAGEWQRSCPPVQEMLLESDLGFVRWDCLIPGGRASVDLGSLRLTGLGYAEHLELTVPPWRLPLKELYWGRFQVPGESLVWIRWISATCPKLMVFRNGIRVEKTWAEPDLVVAGDRTLRFTDSHPLRTGTLGSTVLSGLRWLRHIIPTRVLRLRESKWLSRGVLEGSNKSPPGWAVHEIVTWT